MVKLWLCFRFNIFKAVFHVQYRQQFGSRKMVTSLRWNRPLVYLHVPQLSFYSNPSSKWKNTSNPNVVYLLTIGSFILCCSDGFAVKLIMVIPLFWRGVIISLDFRLRVSHQCYPPFLRTEYPPLLSYQNWLPPLTGNPLHHLHV